MTAGERVTTAPAPAERRRGIVPPLLRERVFRRYWGASTISMFGDQISGIALPLAAVIVLHAQAAEMGYLTALEWLPSMLFGLHLGAWADRRGRRTRCRSSAPRCSWAGSGRPNRLRLRSRVTGAFQAIIYGTRPLGALLGGLLGTTVGLRPALWVATVGGVGGALLLLPSPLPRFKMPDPVR